MTDRSRFYVLLAATLGAVLIPLNTSMLSIALAPVVRAFNIGNAEGTWLILLYLAIMTALQPAAGKLGDRFGHRRVFLIGLVLFGAASTAAALAPNFSVLLISRILQGLGGTALAPNATALIRFTYPVEQQGRAMGLYVGVFSVGLAAGPVIAGLLLALWDWPSIFWVNVPVVLASMWIGWRVLPGNTGQLGVRFDWWGSALFTLMMMVFVFSANLWKDGRLPVPVWSVGVALVALAVFLYWVEERVSDPLFRFSLFRLPGFGAANAAIFLLHFMVQPYLLGVPMYLQQGRGLSPALTGIMMAIFSTVQVVVAPFSGRLSDLLGRRPMVAAGGVLYVVAGLILWRVSAGTPVAWVGIALLAAGVGTGFTTAPVQAASLAVLPRDLVGVGSGVWYSSRYVGNTAGAIAMAVLLPAHLAEGAPDLFLVAAGSAVLLTATARLMPGAEREWV